MLVMTDSATRRSRSPQSKDQQNELGDASTIDFIVTLTELIPEAQEEKRAIINGSGRPPSDENLPGSQLRGRVKRLRR